MPKTPQEVCKEASDFFRENPEKWLQHTGKLDTRFCLVEKLRDISGASITGEKSTELFLAAYNLVDNCLKTFPEIWNDKPGRTVQEVVELLEKASETPNPQEAETPQAG